MRSSQGWIHSVVVENTLGGTRLASIAMAISLRPATEEDAGAVKACVVAAFENYIERIGKPPAPMLLDFAAEIRAARVWVAQQGSQIVGVIVQYETERGFYVDTVAAMPNLQGQGVGRALLTFAEDEARRLGYQSVYLCTNSKMTENQVFYPRIGYVEYERKHEAGYDRVFYEKVLPPASSSAA
jgi:GNAT superfamily N-acetyltransferase